MHPILFRIHNFPLGTYGLMLVLGFFGGMYLARFLGRRDKIEPESLSDLSVTVLMGGIIGAHLLMIIVGLLTPAGQDGAMTFADIFTLSTLRAGGAIHGGVIGGALAYFWRIRKLKLSWRPTMDPMMPGLALGQAIGRIGCFFAGCCYGQECSLPWAVTFRDPEARFLSGTPLEQPLHPVQLYSTLFSLTIMGLLLLLGRKRKFQGQIVAAYFILEGISRSILEMWRGDLDRGVWLGMSWLSTGRLTAILFVLFGIGVWVWCQRKSKMAA